RELILELAQDARQLVAKTERFKRVIRTACAIIQHAKRRLCSSDIGIRGMQDAAQSNCIRGGSIRVKLGPYVVTYSRLDRRRKVPDRQRLGRQFGVRRSQYLKFML